jgi:transposase
VAAQQLIELVSEQPDSLLHELADSMSRLTGSAFAEQDVWRGLHELGFVYSKVTQRAAEANLQDQQHYKQVIEHLHVEPNQLLFMDEVAAVM